MYVLAMQTNTNRKRARVAGFLLAVACAVIAAFGACEAHATVPEAPWTPDEVLLARLVVHEAGFRRGVGDVVGIAHVTRAKARLNRMSIADYVATAHPRATFGRTNRAWVAGLDASFLRPVDWPEERVSWEARGRHDWLRRLREVREALAVEENLCPAYTWGARRGIEERLARMQAAGWTVRDCGPTLNVFLNAP